MTIVHDARGYEAEALLSRVDFINKYVLEIGCGDGRLTWRYAQRAARVDAIDPKIAEIEKAVTATPSVLKSRVHFEAKSLTEFVSQYQSPKYDLAIFAWSF